MYDVKPITSPISVDCGPTCLKMLLAYYDIEVSLEDLIRECNVRLFGCTAKDLKRVGNAHGMDMTVWNMDAAEVMHQDRPSIVWWNYNHFCVCCGMDDNGYVVICNPDRGRFPLDVGTFKSRYSGVTLFNGTPPEMDVESAN